MSGPQVQPIPKAGHRRPSTARNKGDKGKCDKLFSLIIRAEGKCQAQGYALRDGQCFAVCSCPDFPRAHVRGCPLECAHIVTRARSNTRCVEDNAVALCHRHHTWFTAHPIEWARWVERQFGGAYYDRVWALSQRTTKVDWSATLLELKARARELGVLP